MVFIGKSIHFFEESVGKIWFVFEFVREGVSFHFTCSVTLDANLIDL